MRSCDVWQVPFLQLVHFLPDFATISDYSQKRLGNGSLSWQVNEANLTEDMYETCTGLKRQSVWNSDSITLFNVVNEM